MKTLKNAMSIANEIGIQNVYDNLNTKLKGVETEKVAITIIGGNPGCGKTSIVEKLTKSDALLPINSFSRKIACSYEFADVDSCVCNGKQVEWSDVGKLECNNLNLQIKLNSQFLSNNDIIINELSEFPLNDNTTDNDIINYLGYTDLCLYVIDGMMPLSRTDIKLIDLLNRIEIPTILLLSKYDLIPDSNKKDVVEYINSNKYTHGDSIINLIDNELLNSNSLIDRITSIIQEQLELFDVTSNKESFESFYWNQFTVAAINECNSQIEALKPLKEKIDSAKNTKIAKLSSQKQDWFSLENEIMNKRRYVESKIKGNLDAQTDGMLRRLIHDVEVCNDIKQFWEMELSYRMDDVVRAECQNITQVINKEIVVTLQWLQEQIQLKFKKAGVTIPIVSCEIDGEQINIEDIEVADNKKLRIITRVGSAAIIFATGAILASTGVGGAVLAVSTLSGIGAEMFMNHRAKKSKEKIVSLLPRILEERKLRFSLSISQSLQNAFNEIIDTLRKSSREWEVDFNKTIAEEESIGLYNYNQQVSKWTSLIEQINKLNN